VTAQLENALHRRDGVTLVVDDEDAMGGHGEMVTGVTAPR
jgi:hypothetical protein